MPIGKYIIEQCQYGMSILGGIMQGDLKVGEVVVGIGFVDYPEFNGLEGVVQNDCGVINCRARKDKRSLGSQHMYIIKWSTGEENEIIRSNLKRKKPPTTYKGETTIMEMFLPKNIEKNKHLIENDIDEKTLETV